MTSKKQSAQGTRAQIVTIATKLFAKHGYEGTSIEAVLHEAGISRGALYHHFKGKDALFEAVLEALETEVGRQTSEAARGASDPLSALRAGCLAWVRLAGDPVVQRVLLIDAPSVLGWHRWREMDERHALGTIKAALAASGRVAPQMVDTFAHVLLASMNELALLVARARDVKAETKKAAAAVDELLDRLLGGTDR